MIVMKEETVPSSTDIEEYVPTSFIVEDYSEEVCESPNRLVDVNPPNELNIAQEVFIDHDQVTYEVRTIEEVIGFDVAESAEKNNDSEDVFEDEPDNQSQESSIVFYPDAVSPTSKRGVLKKRRGRPPKFQVSEIGNDGKKWYACTVCNEKYEDRMELMQHMRQHNAERPFHCRECGKAFKQAAHLKVHVRQHTGEKPFECTICGKGFRQKAIVDQHMRTHTQLRPYVCSYDNCDKSFAQKTSLDNHTKSHQTGRLSDAFKKQQEEQKRKSILAQEALKQKSLKPKIVQILPNGKKKPVGVVASSNQDKVRTTIVKMTQSQFEQYLQNRAAGLEQSPVSAGSSSSVKSPQKVAPKEMTVKQKTATGPFLAYVNLCKPLLQSERPELSLLEVLKELASRWNAMNKTEKQKFAIIAKQSQDEGIKGNSANILASKAALKNLGFSATAEEESEEVDPANSMEGAVFEIGDSTESFYHSDKQIPEENYFQINEIREKSLNQNVFGKRIVLLSKDGKQRKFSNEEKLEVVTTNFDSDSLADMDQSQAAAEVTFEHSNVLTFEESSDKNAVIFDTAADANNVVYENGSDLEMNNTIFYLPNIVDGEQLGVL